jgi:hypothetical protein
MHEFIRRLFESNYDFALANSFKDFHVKGFNSILLSQSPQLTLRLYVARPYQTDLNDRDNDNLLIHNHRFDFLSQTLYGSMSNISYVNSERDFGAQNYHFYNYKTPISKEGVGSDIEVTNHRVYTLRPEPKYVPQGNSYFFKKEWFHKIEVPRSFWTVILFSEYSKAEGHECLIGAHKPLPDRISTEGLYGRFTRMELNDLMGEVFHLLGA